jgi:hypothetical protein
MTQVLLPFDPAEAIDVAEASKRAARAQRTLREWCAVHGIGRRIAGRWAVSAVALDMLLDGDFESLQAYLTGDRSSERVRAYFVRRSIPLRAGSVG